MAKLTFTVKSTRLRLETEGMLPEMIAKELAKFAKQDVRKRQLAGLVAPRFTRYVNGREGLPEEAVTVPGNIVYVFSNWLLIIEVALAELKSRAPRRSGDFENSFLVIVNGKLVTDYRWIAPDAEVIITNAQPYVRKINLGKGSKFAGVPMLFSYAQKAVLNRFKNEHKESMISAQVKYLSLPSGLHPLVPYILKGHQRLTPRPIAQNRKSSNFRALQDAGLPTHGFTASRRKDREAGQPLSYPALILNMVN